MRIHAHLLEPLHWVRVVMLAALWCLIAPWAWHALTQLVAVDGGASLFFAVGCAVIARRARRGAARVRSHASSAIGVARRRTSDEGRQELALSAQHEAAHAVVAWSGGGTVVCVHVVSDGVVGGECTWLPDREMPLADQAWLSLQVAMASVVVERRLPNQRLKGCTSDVAQAQTCAALIVAGGERPSGYDGPLTVEGLVTAGTAGAQHTLTVNEGLVDAVVDGLMSEPGRKWVNPDLSGLHQRLVRSGELGPATGERCTGCGAPLGGVEGADPDWPDRCRACGRDFEVGS